MNRQDKICKKILPDNEIFYDFVAFREHFKINRTQLSELTGISNSNIQWVEKNVGGFKVPKHTLILMSVYDFLSDKKNRQFIDELYGYKGKNNDAVN